LAPPAEGRLRNQSDVAALAPATDPADGMPVFEMAGLEIAGFGTPMFEKAVVGMPVVEMPGLEMPVVEMPVLEMTGSCAPPAA
jgi:hypothetical protein